MKFVRLEGWGEAQVGASSQLEIPEEWKVELEESNSEPRKPSANRKRGGQENTVSAGNRTKKMKV